MSRYWYSTLSVPLAYFGGITWGSIRLWLLYYDIKIARKSQLFLLSKHLTLSATESFSYAHGDATNAAKAPYTQQKQYKSVTLKVLTAVIIFCIITLLMDIVLGLTAISWLLFYSCILLLLAFYTFFLFKLCCRCGCKCRKCNRNDVSSGLKSSPFRDDWLLLLELIIIWIIWIIGIFGALFFFPFRGQTIHPVLISFLTMVTRVAITLTMLILPYKVSLRLDKSNAKTITISVLKNVLSTKSYFHSFVEHLVQELAIENLTVLLEIWQFKYEQEYNLKPLKVLVKINAEIEKSNTKDQSATQTNSVNSDWFRDVTPTIAYEDTCNILGNNGATLSVNSTNAADTRTMVKFLKSLPWHRLPLAQSIASHLSETEELDVNKKWKQCSMIYAKYFGENSYDSVNVSYATKHEVNNDYYNLLLYRQSKFYEPSLPAAPGVDANNKSDSKPSRMVIENDDELKEKILTVFDVVIDDIVHNLRDCLTRFVLSEEFKLAH
eukprot:236629_1